MAEKVGARGGGLRARSRGVVFLGSFLVQVPRGLALVDLGLGHHILATSIADKGRIEAVRIG